MEVLYHGIKTRYAYDFPLCFPHELLMIWECWFPCSYVYWSLVKARKNVWESQVIDSSSITQSEALWVWRCDVTTSNSIQDGGVLVVNILVFDLRVQLQHCTYQRKTLVFALIKVSTFICKREISGLSSPLSDFVESQMRYERALKFPNFNLHFLLKYRCMNLRSKFKHSKVFILWFLNTDKLVKKTRSHLAFSTYSNSSTYLNYYF